MNYKRYATLLCLILATFLLAACTFGVSEEEYASLTSKYASLEVDYKALEKEYKALETELENVRGEIGVYKSDLAKAHEYAQVFDVYVDVYRWKAGLAPLYGYTGTTSENKEYLQKLYDISEAVGDGELADKLDEALSLPQSDTKDRAWAEWHVQLAERLSAATSP